MKIALLALPWPLFNRPSIQLGVLKGYLKEKWPALRVDAFHPYLPLAARLGYDLYHNLSQSSGLSEAVSFALLFPSQKEKAKVFAQREAKKRNFSFDFEKTLLVFEKALTDYLEAIDWSAYQAVGISVCLNQLGASLWAAKWLKERFPHLPIIFGGSSCAEEMGRSLLAKFPWIDFIINREGERPLLLLLRHLLEGEPFPEKGVFFRQDGKINGRGFFELPSAEIPSPAYEDYFREVMALPPEKRFFPMIPLEASRGCWWFKCRFCNLNLQWSGFRKKPLDKVLREITAHAKAGFLDFAFMDNALAPAEAKTLFETLSHHQKDYRFFAELRAIYERKDYFTFARGGLKWVQIGIEALSTSLLKRLNKGTRAIDNVAAMRHSAEAGLRLEANLILEFPGSTKTEVDETLKALEYVFPFRPLTTVSFWLGYGCHVFRHPNLYGLKRIYPHPNYKYLLPPEFREGLVPLLWAYAGDRGRQRRLWRPVRERVKAWEEKWRRLSNKFGPLLSYLDGGNFILIRQVLPSGTVLHHRLKGVSREIYLFLQDVRDFEAIKAKFPAVSAENLKNFLADLERKKLIFKEDDRFIALAVHRNTDIG